MRGGRRSALLYYRALLHAYPSWFRARYGREAVALFGRLHEDARARGRLAVLRLWLRAAAAVIAGGLEERLRPSGDGPEPRRGRRVVGILEALFADARLALRSLRRRPAFALSVIGMIGLGVGATTTVYSVVDRVLIRPLPYPDADRLVTFAKGTSAFPVPDYEDLRDGTRSFTDWGASWDRPAVLTGVGDPTRIELARVTPTLLPLLGARALRGRLVAEATTSDGGSGEGRTAVLSHSLWRTRFGGTDVLGSTITLDGQAYTVVGVLDPAFVAPEALALADVDVYVPLDLQDPELRFRSIFILSVLAKLAPGTTLESAGPELEGLSARLAEAYPRDWQNSDGEPVPILAEPLSVATLGDIGQTLYMFLAAVGIMLLVAVVNVANLTLARGTERDHETAVRTALGAGRVRIVSFVLTESVLLGLAGGLVGFLIAHAGVAGFLILEPGGIPRIAELDVDARILLFAVALSIFTALVFGLAPALSSAAVGARSALGEAGRSGTASRGRTRFRNGLVVVEVGLALTLLAAAGVLFHGFVLLRTTPIGFESEGVLTALIDGENMVPAGRRLSFGNELLDAVRVTPGVRSVAASWQLPFGPGRCCFRSNAWAVGPPGDTVSPFVHPVTTDYFVTLGASIVEGRALTDEDQRAGALPPPGPRDPNADTHAPTLLSAVVNRIVANQLWPGEPAVGRRFRFISFPSTEFQVVGVIEPMLHWGLAPGAGPDIYVPFGSFAAWIGLYDVAVRHAGPDAPIAHSIRDAVHSLAPDLPVDVIQSMGARVSSSVATPRFYATLLLAFAGIALLLAAAGVYGTMAYTVGQRRREFGIRMALGAGSPNLMRMVLGRGMTLVGLGIVAGFAGALAFTRVLGNLVYQVPVVDPLSLAAASAVLVAAALFACWLPARRAGKLDPMTTLRTD